MIWIIRLVVILNAVAECTVATLFARSLFGLGNGFGGSGDGAGTSADTSGNAVATLVILAIWLFLISPHVVMVAGAFNLISMKGLRLAFPFSLWMLVLFAFAEFAMRQPVLICIGFSNLLAAGMWVLFYHRYSEFARQRL